MKLKLFYAYTFLINTVFILPIIVPFYRDELGLSFHDFLIAEALFAFVVIALEVPSGWFADVMGRKITIVIASISGIIGYTLIMTASGFWQATLGQAVIGIAVSFHSGTLSAMLYDTLFSAGREDEYRQREGFRHGLGLYAVAFGCAMGGLLYQWNHYLPWILEVVCLCASLVIAICMKEPERHKQEVQKNPLHDMFVTMRYALHGHKDIGALIGLTALIFGSTKIFLWAQQPYYADLHIPESVYGFLLGGAMLLGGAAGHFGHCMLREWQGLAVVKILLIVVISICCISGMVLSYPGFAVLTLGSVIWGFGWPRIQETINHAVGSERRATILSTASLMISLTFIPLSLLLGWIEENQDITLALLIHGAIIAITGGLFVILLRSRTVSRNQVL